MSISLRFKDRLDGESNFSPWKERIFLFLEEADPWDIVTSTQTKIVVVPNATTNDVGYTTYKKKNIKTKNMIDNFKDHVSHHVTGKSHVFEMCTSLTKLYQSTNETKKWC